MDYCCPPPKVPKIKVLLECENKGLCDPLQPLIRDWSICYTFAPSTDLTPEMFQAQGLFSQCGLQIDSVAQKYLAELDHPPTLTDLDGSTIQVPIPGRKGSTCSRFDPIKGKDHVCCDGHVEIYFFGQGDNIGKYHAILEAHFPASGNELLCRVKEIVTEADPNLPIDVTFIAVLRYIETLIFKPITNTFELPPDFEEDD